MVGVEGQKCEVGDCRIMDYYYSNKRKKTSILSLPEEIVFIILLQLPADVLYYCLRFVCRQWYDIITSPHFIREHLCRSTTGLLSQYYMAITVPTFTTFRESNPVETETSLPKGTEIYTTFDGLVVLRVGNKFYVANLLTKQSMPLPPLNVHPSRDSGLYKFALARGQSLNEYKVFLTSRPPDYSVPTQVMYITLGKDSAWVPIASGGLVDYLRESLGLVSKAISVGRSVYWYFGPWKPVIAFDADSGSFHRLPNPVLEHEWKVHIYAAGGEHSPVIVQEKQDGVFSVWYMPDDDEYGRRTSAMMTHRVERIDVSEYLPSTKCIHPISPAAWVNNGELLVFRNSFGRSFAYNVKTGRSFKFGKMKSGSGYMGDFVYSLVPLAPSLPPYLHPELNYWVLLLFNRN